MCMIEKFGCGSPECLHWFWFETAEYDRFVVTNRPLFCPWCGASAKCPPRPKAAPRKPKVEAEPAETSEPPGWARWVALVTIAVCIGFVGGAFISALISTARLD